MAAGRQRALAAVDRAAAAAGLRPGMALSHARALRPDLAALPGDPAGEAQDLARLAVWALRYSPIAAPCPPDGLWIDATGATHLFGGEAAMLQDLEARLGRAGFAARAAIADTAGAAWAVARFGQGPLLVPPGAVRAALADLPAAALRLPPEAVAALRRVGLVRIAQLWNMPRAGLALRFGAEPVRRLDQALGREEEPIAAVDPPALRRRRPACPGPVTAPDDLRRAIDRLAVLLCRDLAAAGQGARRLDLVFHRVDGMSQAIRTGTARPSRDPTHLARLFVERLETIDPGLGIEAITLTAWHTEPLAPAQLGLEPDTPAAGDLAALVDRLANRLGAARLYRLVPVESDLPERAAAPLPPLAPAAGAGWPEHLPRPSRLLRPPEPVETLALLPDHPPRLFVWRGVRRRVRRADGPERVFGEWWRRPAEVGEVRDYFRVEDEEGSRFWLFRLEAPEQGSRWFLHGIFA